MKKSYRYLLSVFILLSLLIGISGQASGAVTTKTLSTTYTLANMGSQIANIVVNYVKEDGNTWTADPGNTTFDLPANGGQKQIRQYFDTTMTPGRGSAVVQVTNGQPVAAIVLMLARAPQVPTSGGYEGILAGDTSVNVPLVMKNKTTGSGLGNSQLVFQNMDGVPLTVSVEFVAKPGSGKTGAIKTFTTPVAANASQYYDLDVETLLADDWIGSAVVTAKDGSNNFGKIGVVSNLFLGPDLLYTVNGFPSASIRSKWFVPYFTSKLGNGQNTSVTVQNLSGGDLAIGELTLNCKADSVSSVNTPIALTNTLLVKDKETYEFNSLVLSAADAPAGWHGSCEVSTTGNNKNLAVAVFVRQVNNALDGGGAGFSGIPNPKDAADVEKHKTITLPYVNKRLDNGVATVISVENIGTANATVTLTYKASAEYTGLPQELVIPNVPISTGEALVRNYRLNSTAISEPDLPANWFGSLTITSDQPLQAFTFVTNYQSAVGDTYFGFDAFPKQ